MTCKNCHETLINTQNYCTVCGAKVIRHRLTFKHLWAEFVEKVLNIDNTLFRTYRTLWTKPEAVINGFIEGQRKKYFNVFSYFAVAISLAGFQLFILRKFYPEAFDITALVADQKITNAPNVDWVYDYYSILALLNLPFYALLAKLTFLGLKKYNYVEHLVINTYIIAQYTITTFFIIIALVVLGVNYFLAGNLSAILLIFYVSYCYKRLYPLSLKQLFLRILLFFGIILGLMIVLGLVQFLLLYLTGDLDAVSRASQKSVNPT